MGIPRARPGPSALERVFTIGAFGFNQRSFLRALTDNRIDLFVDLRARRAVRGAEYAFVNAARLQVALAKAGIPYVHAESLAPSEEMRAIQAAADEATGTPSRQRVQLSNEYIKLYHRERLRGVSAGTFAKTVLGPARRPVLFCVETEPAACHRSLVAEHLSKGLAAPVEHLKP